MQVIISAPRFATEGIL